MINLEEQYEALEKHRDEGNQAGVADSLFKIGCAQLKRGRPEEGLPALQEAYDICKVQGNDTGRVEILKRVLPQLLEEKKYDETAAGLEIGFALAKKLNSPSAEVSFLEVGAALDWRQNRAREAVEKLITAAEICRENEDTAGQYIMLEQAVPLLRRAERWADALRVYKIMTDLAEAADDRARFALTLVGQAEMEKNLGRTETAIDLLELALRGYKMTGNLESIGLVEAELASLKQNREND